ncbi:PIN domain-containing protein [Amycolatopsis keratiniphila]|uniref:PIN domain-containing protein n=1 Tax=Amycolatopsis keratiniphila subsp. keratiniphila TaxID=227715 RepID=A0A1W2LIW6_9PSEU|nr:PIN domain-containing protein [Amycolatopsis keratiniphila]ONF62785.1 PIN domain-containing protein [Amycolatopsis keratiniphila subsp. keratiniphila]
MPFPAFLDACVLIPIRLTDLLLRLAEAGTYRALWSGEVLDEVERNLVGHFGLEPQQAKRRLTGMRSAFPDSEVTGYEPLIPTMTNHPKDRHVLAAAVHANAAVIVTANLKDFPPSALEPHQLEAVHPDDFLLDQLGLYPAATLRCLREQVCALERPPETLREFLERFERTVPVFSKESRRLLDRG